MEQQLSGQSIIVPQGGDVLLANGQIEGMQNGQGHCNCSLQIAKSAPIRSPGSATPSNSAEIATRESAQPSSEPARIPTGAPSSVEKPASKDQPIFQVDMPPLRFDANAKIQTEPDPRLMAIVRRVRVRPTLIFQGRVEGEPVTTAAATPAPTAVTPPGVKPQPADESSFVDRVRSFFRRLWSRGA